jgi:hypothetical protein
MLSVSGAGPVLMVAFLYRCPITGEQVQGWTELDCSDTNEYETVHCLACQQIHLINPATGKVVGDEQD